MQEDSGALVYYIYNDILFHIHETFFAKTSDLQQVIDGGSIIGTVVDDFCNQFSVMRTVPDSKAGIGSIPIGLHGKCVVLIPEFQFVTVG